MVEIVILKSPKKCWHILINYLTEKRIDFEIKKEYRILKFSDFYEQKKNEPYKSNGKKYKVKWKIKIEPYEDLDLESTLLMLMSLIKYKLFLFIHYLQFFLAWSFLIW
ncbi:MAG: hypothetical protein GF329_01740 [Candidatus Lokiarchaeota archaeon]|nr:hypothetical protein [Candidatus Lokiarchaeota archaeon]